MSNRNLGRGARLCDKGVLMAEEFDQSTTDCPHCGARLQDQPARRESRVDRRTPKDGPEKMWGRRKTACDRRKNNG